MSATDSTLPEQPGQTPGSSPSHHSTDGPGGQPTLSSSAQHTAESAASADPAAAGPAAAGSVTTVQQRWVTEDWAATATGLALLLLLISGLLPAGWIL